MKNLRSKNTSSPHCLRMPPALRLYRADVGKGKKRMAQKRIGMREWLEQLLDGDECNGVAWIDKQRKIFGINWTHASRQDFDTQEHADVLVRYAKLTGRSKVMEGSKNGYHSKLKSNFRSALNSLSDCIQIKDMTEEGEKKKGEAVKVFQFIDHDHPEYKKKKLLKNKSQRSNKRCPRGKTRKTRTSTTAEDLEEMQYSTNDSTDNEVESELATTTSVEENNDFVDFNNFFLEEQHGNFQDQMPCLLFDQISQNYQNDMTSSQIIQTFSDTTSITIPLDDRLAQSLLNSNINSDSQTDVLQDLTSLPELKPALPNFGALGVDDTFHEPAPYSSKTHQCGGLVRIKKEVHNKPNPRPEINIELFHKGQNGVISFDQIDLKPEIDQNELQTENENANLCAAISAANSVCYQSTSINEGSDAAVTTLMTEPNAVIQGENYDLSFEQLIGNQYSTRDSTF